MDTIIRDESGYQSRGLQNRKAPTLQGRGERLESRYEFARASSAWAIVSRFVGSMSRSPHSAPLL